MEDNCSATTVRPRTRAITVTTVPAMMVSRLRASSAVPWKASGARAESSATLIWETANPTSRAATAPGMIDPLARERAGGARWVGLETAETAVAPAIWCTGGGADRSAPVTGRGSRIERFPGGCRGRVMGLSESEQHKLDEIERALLREDPRFAASISIRRARRRRRIFVGVVFLLGMMVLLIGLVATAQSVIVGVLISIVGLLAMLAGVLVLLRRPGRGS